MGLVGFRMREGGWIHPGKMGFLFEFFLALSGRESSLVQTFCVNLVYT